MNRLTAAAVMLGMSYAATAMAAGYPERPVRVVVASAPGGGTDFVGRTTARKVTDILGQQFVIDNRGGAAGILGSEIVAKAEPDGYTVLVVFSNFSTYPSLGKKLTFDIEKSFTPISALTTTPLVLVVNNSLPAKSVKELIELAKTKSLNYAAPGVGSMGHLAAELFNIAASVKMTHVAYKGGGPAITALIGNEVDLYFSTPPSALAQMRAGRLRGLAVTGGKRVSFAPDLPTVAEAGLPGYDVEGWFGLFAPAGTPAPAVKTLHRAFAQAVQAPDVQELFARQGVTPYGSTPEEFRKVLRRDIDKWAKVIRTANIRVN
jgi:tripartite-type tricarboxylate transporter receptor subunit TctC